jgi:23S rRNA pseudouridine2605 synthase
MWPSTWWTATSSKAGEGSLRAGPKWRRWQELEMKAGSRRTGLARALSKLGYCSRSHAEKLIREGRVRLDGRAPRDPETPADLRASRIEVDGALIKPQAKIYLMLNKPRGVVTTASDEKGRSTVYDFVGREQRWIAPVGRLDKASEGLLLLTNDSQWAAQVLEPERRLEKIYHAHLHALVDDELLNRLRAGVHTKEGDFLRLKRVHVLRAGEKRTWLEIALEEGKNRHIRRMLGQLGIEVIRLVRVAIGPLVLGKLSKGRWRELTPAEKHAIDEALARRKAGIKGLSAATW